MRCRPPAIALLALAAASCATVEEPDTGPRPVSFALSYGHYAPVRDSPGLREVPAPDRGEGLRLTFLVVRGALTGTPDRDVFRSFPVGQAPEFELRLPGSIPGAVPPFAPGPLELTPPDTRIVRLETFHHYPVYGIFRGGGGFVHAPTGNAMLLVHFSGPARLRGSRPEAGAEYRYAVDIERAGWSWLIVEPRAHDAFTVRRYTGAIDDIELAILLPPLMTDM